MEIGKKPMKVERRHANGTVDTFDIKGDDLGSGVVCFKVDADIEVGDVVSHVIPNGKTRTMRITEVDVHEAPARFNSRLDHTECAYEVVTAEVMGNVSPRQYAEPVPEVDPREVFVVVGRNTDANNSMFAFLRAINLKPIEWSMAIAATGSGSPYIGDALEAAFARAKAVVVFMTPDDIAQLRPEYASGGDDDPELKPTPQARPNVLFEAGMALGLHPNRTILVELGALRSFSDVAGRHAVRLDNSPAKRGELANRLKNAGCAVDTSGSDWYSAGDFTAPKGPSGPTPTGRRIASTSPAKPKNRLDARYLHRTSGSDRITVQNVGPEDVFDLTSPNVKDFHGRIDGFPVRRLPVGKSATLIAIAAMGVPDTWDLVVTGKTESGEEFTEPLFLDLNG
jgi:predicted nucleotide-binding protein